MIRTQRKMRGVWMSLLAPLFTVVCGGCQANANSDLTAFLAEVALNAYAALLL